MGFFNFGKKKTATDWQDVLFGSTLPQTQKELLAQTQKELLAQVVAWDCYITNGGSKTFCQIGGFKSREELGTFAARWDGAKSNLIELGLYKKHTLPEPSFLFVDNSVGFEEDAADRVSQWAQQT